MTTSIVDVTVVREHTVWSLAIDIESTHLSNDSRLIYLRQDDNAEVDIDMACTKRGKGGPCVRQYVPAVTCGVLPTVSDRDILCRRGLWCVRVLVDIVVLLFGHG